MNALDGLRVLDLCGFPGIWTAMALADFGADVIRIEEPKLSGRRAAGSSGGSGRRDGAIAGLNYMNRNKRLIRLDLKSDEGRSAFHRLVETADVVLEGWRPGVAKRLGVDYETIAGINPQIVLCSITGYGQSGPYANVVGHDVAYMGMSGTLGLMGPADGIPAIPSQQIADLGGGGQGALIGILLALHERQHSNTGQHVDISMTDGVVSWLVTHAAPYFGEGVIPERGRTLQTGRWATYSVYKTRDNRFIALAPLEPWFWRRFCELSGLEEFIDRQFDEAHREETKKAVADLIATKDRDTWWELLSCEDVCIGKVYDLVEVFEDPHFLAREMVVQVDGPDGPMQMLGIPWKLSRTPGRINTPPAFPGQHTRSVLTGLGYSEDQVESLIASGAAL